MSFWRVLITAIIVGRSRAGMRILGSGTKSGLGLCTGGTNTISFTTADDKGGTNKMSFATADDRLEPRVSA
eukprot:scaffold34682_cov243-Amphora_coffeaeformis.AAC.8